MADDSQAAQQLIHLLSHEPCLYGVWLDKDWRVIWDTLNRIAAGTQKPADPSPDNTRKGQPVTFLHTPAVETVPVWVGSQTHRG